MIKMNYAKKDINRQNALIGIASNLLDEMRYKHGMHADEVAECVGYIMLHLVNQIQPTTGFEGFSKMSANAEKLYAEETN